MLGPAPLDKPEFPDEFVDKCRAIFRKRTVAHAERQRACALMADPKADSSRSLPVVSKWSSASYQVMTSSAW
jgi:hypothetical protein